MNLQLRYNKLIEYFKFRQNKNNLNPLIIYKNFDRHHIIPSCLGGKWEIDNIVIVTRKEHTHLHFLLSRIHKDNYKLVHAYSLLKYCKTPQMLPKDSYEYKQWYKANLKHCGNGCGWGRNKVPIICLDTMKIYDSISEAYKDYPECSNINSAAYGYLKFCNGNHHFMTLERYYNASESEINNILNWDIHRVRRDHIGKPCVCIELNVLFRTCADAEDYLITNNKKSGHIRHVCNGTRNKCGGYHWRYATDDEVKLIDYEDSTTIMYSLSNEEVRSS